MDKRISLPTTLPIPVFLAVLFSAPAQAAPQAVLYRSRMNPALGRNFEAMDPLEWLARVSDHIPDPGQHRTIFYGEYSSRARAGCQPLEPGATSTTADQPPPRRRCPASWARLIAKVYQVDPLVCTRCGQRMSILAFVSDRHSIGRILEHLGLRSPELDRPPPAREIREITRAHQNAYGYGSECLVGASCGAAGTPNT